MRGGEPTAKTLLVHPSPLMYSEIYLRLEPLGLECVAGAIRAAGHDVRLLDLQIFGLADYEQALRREQPQAVGFSLNYLANTPEVTPRLLDALPCGVLDGVPARRRRRARTRRRRS